MLRLAAFAFLGIVFVVVWQVSARISPGAIDFGAGALFGVLAGIPASLLISASAQKRDSPRQVPDRCVYVVNPQTGELLKMAKYTLEDLGGK